MMQWTVKTWNEFRDVWDGVHSFLMAFEFPPLMQIIDEIRRATSLNTAPQKIKEKY